MFRTLIYPSTGAFDCAVELPHRSFCSRFVVCWRFGAAGFGWCPCCRRLCAGDLVRLGLSSVRVGVLFSIVFVVFLAATSRARQEVGKYFKIRKTK